MTKLLSTVLLLLLTTSYHGASSPTSAQAQQQQPAATKVVTLQILGMATPSCPALVKAAVGKMAGVEKVEASLKSKTATIVYRPDRTNPQKIRAVIKDQVGFDSKIVKG